MSENTKIEWADHTFNPWEGCQKVGPGCDNCYAETRNARFGGGQAVNWGPGAPRRRTSAATWNLPRRWNAQAEAFQQQHGRRQRVFCASLADVFDNQVPAQWRVDLFELIRATPNLDWLLLTKRIGNVERMGWPVVEGTSTMLPNIWLGATICNQEELDRDIQKLLSLRARVSFLSIEPMLGPINLRFDWFREAGCYRDGKRGRPLLQWVICGGESGPGARPMHPDWARDLRNQCAAAGVPFLFKQWGEWASVSEVAGPGQHHRFDDGATVRRVGKARAGRTLDGIEHNGFPS